MPLAGVCRFQNVHLSEALLDPSGCCHIQCEAEPHLFPAVLLSLQTGNPEVVADLYAPDGVLLPTVSNQVTMHDVLHNLELSFQ